MTRFNPQLMRPTLPGLEGLPPGAGGPLDAGPGAGGDVPQQLLDPAALGVNPAQAALWQQAVQQFVAGRGVEAMLTDPRMRAELERVIKEQFQAVNQAGRPVEARPGSKLAEGLATGDLSQLSGVDLMMLLAALLQFADMRRDPGSIAQRHDAPLAPRGSWGGSNGGNAFGGGTTRTGGNAPGDAVRGPAPAAGPIPDGTPAGTRLATAARDVASSMNSTGWCYRAVKSAVARATGVRLTGGSAHMAADQLARSGRFREVSVSPDQLRSLPPGAVVVWGRTDRSPDGHISVALGNGQEASDHIQTQMTSLRGAQNYRVFVPNG
jgi:hypothetical protein